jgi:hypothetical protein
MPHASKIAGYSVYTRDCFDWLFKHMNPGFEEGGRTHCCVFIEFLQ